MTKTLTERKIELTGFGPPRLIEILKNRLDFQQSLALGEIRLIWEIKIGTSRKTFLRAQANKLENLVAIRLNLKSEKNKLTLCCFASPQSLEEVKRAGVEAITFTFGGHHVYRLRQYEPETAPPNYNTFYQFIIEEI